MSYHFVYGPSGSGKTYRVFDDCIKASLADDGGRFLVIVPEQATTAAEKQLVKMHPYHAMSNIEVLSFNRLAHRVFDELGIKNPEVLDDISKAMILRRIASDHEDELTVWKSRFDKPGFVDNLKSMISELYQYGVTVDDIKNLADANADDSSADANAGDSESAMKANASQLPARLKNKLRDLSLMYGEFTKFIKDEYITTEEIADILASVIHKSNIIKGATIILDGFTGFTPIQYKIISEFLSYAKEVIFTVSISDDAKLGNKADSEELFAMSKTMYNDIADLAAAVRVSHEDDVRTERKIHFDFLEKHLLRYDGARCASEEEKSSIKMIRALNASEEIEFVASDIARAVKKEGLRYRDIAIIAADVNSYADIIRHEFTLSDIPFYMDENLKLENNALTLLIDSLLEVIKSDYSYDSVMRFLKTGLVSEDEDMTAALDIYMYVCGRRGYKRMSQYWDYIPRELKSIDKAALNDFKDEIIALVEEVKNTGETIEEKTDAILAFLEKTGTEQKLLSMSETFAASGDDARRREYEKSYEEITNLLKRISKLAGDAKFDVDDYRETFDAGAGQIKLGMIPSGMDRVLVGDITRTRLDDIKYLYVIGANEGNIPKLLNRSSVITDTEKTILESSGLKLAPTIKEDLFIQRYYLYRMLTKPCEKLTLTFAGMDADGKGMEASYLIGHISKLYGGIEVTEASRAIGLYDGKSALRYAEKKLREIRGGGFDAADTNSDADKFREIYAYLKNSEDYNKALEAVTAAALYRYQSDSISKQAAQNVYGAEINGSPTRLERFAECPYKHFASYGLKISELRKFSMETMDMGNLMHKALETVFAKAERSNIDLVGISEEARNEMVKDAVNEAIRDDQSSKYDDTAHNQYLIERLTRTAQRTLWVQLEEYKNSGYSFYESERPFNMNGLSGRIDRIDVKPDENDSNKLLYRVIDYKTSGKKFSLSNIEQGFDLQLAIYMIAAEEILKAHEKKTIVPGGMYYSSIDDPIIDLDEKTKSRTVEEEIVHELRPSGIGDDEQKLRLVMDYTKKKIADMRSDIRNGNIAIAPSGDGFSNSCTFCEYRSVCGFDKKIPGFKMKHRNSCPENDAMDKIKEELN